MSDQPSLALRLRAHAVHVYTASGLVFVALSMLEVCKPNTDARWVFFWLLVASFIDMTDGTLARRFDVKKNAPLFDGRKIDDIVDFLNFTFVPLVLVVKMGWVQQPGILWVTPALIASVLAFANVGVKDEENGYFIGFPSYWNVVAFYAGYWPNLLGGWANVVMLVALAVLSLVPVGFMYPTMAPKRWRLFMILGGYAWCLWCLGMLPSFPNTPLWAVGLSLCGPVFYGVISLVEWTRLQRARASLPQPAPDGFGA